jgi:outer membrane immunogenic protein
MISGADMKKLATAIATSALIATPAFAADMAVKAPPPAPAPVYSWTGFYLGGNIGASFGRAKTDFNADPFTITFAGSSGSLGGFAGSAITEPSGFIGGGQIGYNWQLSAIWVAGLEADFQGADEKDSTNLSNPFSFSGFLSPSGAFVHGTGTGVTNYATRIDWFGTVRGRVGYLFGDGAVMSYVTGGLAYGRVGVSGTNNASGAAIIEAVGTFPFSITHAIGHSQVNTGWTVGSGTEGKLLIPGWTYKIEYLYVDLGSLNDTDIPAEATFSGGRVTTHTHFTDNIIRAGLNYQFH